MKTKILLIALVSIGFVGGGYSSGYSNALGSPNLGGKPPVITSFFAPEQGRYGDPLRIYLAAEDPSGEMLRIAARVTQVGYGSYPTDWVYLKPQDQKGFTGYLQWNTLSNHTAFMPEWTRITIKISVLDKSGNESNEIVLPYEFVTERTSPLVPAAFSQANVGRLGYINVNLFNPFDMGAHDHDMFRMRR